jgi:hypothetical protein
MSEPRTITRSQYLQAMALYTMVRKRQQEVDAFNIEMNKILELDAPTFQDSRVTDGTWKDEPFDLVLSYVNITVEPDTTAVPNGERASG